MDTEKTNCTVLVEDIDDSKYVSNTHTDDDDNNENTNTNSSAVARAAFNCDNKRIERHMESIFVAIRTHLSATCLLELLEVDDFVACSSDWVDYRSAAPGRRTLVMEAALYRRVDVLNILLLDARDLAFRQGRIDIKESDDSYSSESIFNNNNDKDSNNDNNYKINQKTKPRLDLSNEFDDFTALMEAVYGGSEEFVSLLLHHGAGNLFSRSKQVDSSCEFRGLWHHGKCALEMALLMKNNSIVATLSPVYTFVYIIYVLEDGCRIHIEADDIESLYFFL